MAPAVLARPDLLASTTHDSPPASSSPRILHSSSSNLASSVSSRPLLPAKQSRKPATTSEPIMIYNNAVYYPNWRLRDPTKTPASMASSAISHVFYAFARVDTDGTVKLSQPYEDDEMIVDGHRGGIRATLALKAHNDRLKVILSLGGGDTASSNAFVIVASNRERRMRCAQTARQLVDHYGLDGIDIDWEHLYDMNHCNSYLQLLADMRQALPAKQGYMLTSALGASEWSLKNIDLKVACHYLDFVNVITYDFCGPWSPVAGHASGTYAPAVLTDGNAMATTLMSALRYYITLNGIPPRKINVGIPCFGRSFLGAKRAGDAYTGKGGDNGLFPYYDLPRPGATAEFDNEAMAAYCIGGDGGFVSYDNPTSVAVKAELVKEHGLAGLFFWDAPADHDGCRSIIMAGYLTLSPGNAY